MPMQRYRDSDGGGASGPAAYHSDEDTHGAATQRQRRYSSGSEDGSRASVADSDNESDGGKVSESGRSAAVAAAGLEPGAAMSYDQFQAFWAGVKNMYVQFIVHRTRLGGVAILSLACGCVLTRRALYSCTHVLAAPCAASPRGTTGTCSVHPSQAAMRPPRTSSAPSTTLACNTWCRRPPRVWIRRAKPSSRRRTRATTGVYWWRPPTRAAATCR